MSEKLSFPKVRNTSLEGVMDNLSGQKIKGYELKERIGGGNDAAATPQGAVPQPLLRPPRPNHSGRVEEVYPVGD